MTLIAWFKHAGLKYKIARVNADREWDTGKLPKQEPSLSETSEEGASTMVPGPSNASVSKAGCDSAEANTAQRGSRSAGSRSPSCRGSRKEREEEEEAGGRENAVICCLGVLVVCMVVLVVCVLRWEALLLTYRSARMEWRFRPSPSLG